MIEPTGTGRYKIIQYHYQIDDRTLRYQTAHTLTRVDVPDGSLAQIRLAADGDEPTAYMTSVRETVSTIVEWRDGGVREITVVNGRRLVLGEVLSAAETRLITWMEGDSFRAQFIEPQGGELVGVPIDLPGLSGFWPLLHAPGFALPNGFGFLSRKGPPQVARLHDETASLTDMEPTNEPRFVWDITSTSPNRVFVAGMSCESDAAASCVLAPMLWDLDMHRIETLESPRVISRASNVQIACAQEVCASAWTSDAADGQILTRAFNRITGEIRTAIRPLPDARTFCLTSDGANFLLVAQRLDSSLGAHYADHELEWSEPIYVPDESVVIDGKIGCVFDGTRFVTLYERAVLNGYVLRESTFSPDGSFFGARTVFTTREFELNEMVSNGAGGYLASLTVRTGWTSSGWNPESHREAVALRLDPEGEIRTESLSEAFADWSPYSSSESALLGAIRNGPSAVIGRAIDFATLPVLNDHLSSRARTISAVSMWIETSDGFVRSGAPLIDRRSWLEPSLFGDEDGFVAVFRPAFRGPPLIQADRFVVRRIDRMGALVGDEMPLDGIAQIEAVTSAGRSEMAVVYRTDLDPIAPGAQLSELRARIVTVPSVPID